jgi:hypothetical protein
MEINECGLYDDDKLYNSSSIMKMQAVHEGRVWTNENLTSTKFIPNFARFEATFPFNTRNIYVCANSDNKVSIEASGTQDRDGSSSGSVTASIESTNDNLSYGGEISASGDNQGSGSLSGSVHIDYHF